MSMRTLRFFGVALAATVLGTGFCACSDDDDKGLSSSPSNNNISVITNNNGEKLLLTSIGHWKFEYDAQGRCTSFDWGTISYDPYEITLNDDDDYEENLTLSFNNSGYVAKMMYDYDVIRESGWYSYTDTTEFTYNSDGHLTKASTKWNGKENEEGGDSWSGSQTATFTWSGDNMSKMVVSFSEEEIEDGNSYSYKYNSEMTYTYGDATNDCEQYTMALWCAVADEAELYYVDLLCFIGYLGKGTANLPSSFELNWEDNEDGDTDTDSRSESFTYTKNGDGTIATETMDGSTYAYSYIPLAEAGTRSTAATLSTNTSAQREIIGKRSSHRSRMHRDLDAEN